MAAAPTPPDAGAPASAPVREPTIDEIVSDPAKLAEFKRQCREETRQKNPDMTDQQFEENWRASEAVFGF